MMTELPGPGWWLNPDRTLLATRPAGPGGHLDVLRLDRAGHAAAAPRHTVAEPGDWHVLGWASTGVLTLWRHRPGGSELLLVDVTGAAWPPVRHRLTGRPVSCRMDRARRVAVVVALPTGGQSQLWLHVPQRQTYQRIIVDTGALGVGAWDYDRRILAVNVAAGVMIFRDGTSGPAPVDVAWPGGVHPAGAAGCGAGRVGLTGLIAGTGEPVPGYLDATTRTVRWFRGHTGFSCVDVGPSGRHLLAARQDGERFDYRVLDASGNRVGDFGAGPAIVGEPAFAAGETHAVALHRSPVSPPSLCRWDVRTGIVRRPLPAAGTPPQLRARSHLAG